MALARLCFETDTETGIPVVKLVGDINLDSLIKLFASISDTAYPSSDEHLWDLRGVSSPFSSTEIRSLSRFVKRMAKVPRRTAKVPRRVAIVVEKDVHFGLTRMFEMLSEQPGITRRVFREYGQARDWLLSTAPTTEQVPAPYLGTCQGPASQVASTLAEEG